MEDECGRPLGLQFHRATGNLYIADAYYGLLVVGPGGGLATRLVVAAEGKPLGFTNGVDVDQERGLVYFTDSSTQFQRRSSLPPSLPLPTHSFIFTAAVWPPDS